MHRQQNCQLCKKFSPSQSAFNRLGLDKTAVVTDQILCAKATEVVWEQRQKFESIQLMMGNFHVICNMLLIIGKLFRDAGLRAQRNASIRSNTSMPPKIYQNMKWDPTKKIFSIQNVLRDFMSRSLIRRPSSGI